MLRGTRRKRKFLYQKNSACRYQAGVTLMELLVVLMLLVIVLGIAFTFYYFINHSFNRGSDQHVLQTDIRLAGDFITKEIRNATEIEVLPVPFEEDPSWRYIYLESNSIKSKVAGAVSSITEETIVGTELFAFRKDEPSGRYFVKIEIQGKKKEEQYTLTTEILLNNIKSVAEPLSGNAIRYKKLE
jgi:prepilin-type N-terminal cleavage/methylation domain-containing protein